MFRKRDMMTIWMMVISLVVVVAFIAFQKADQVMRDAEKHNQIPPVTSEDPKKADAASTAKDRALDDIRELQAADEVSVPGSAAPAKEHAEPPKEGETPAAPAAPAEPAARGGEPAPSPAGESGEAPPEEAEEGESTPDAEGGEAGGAGKSEKDDWMKAWLDKHRATFRPMESKFERVEKLDEELLQSVIDDMRMPEVTSNLHDESDVYFHVFCYLRSHTPAELRKKADDKISYADMASRPEPYRGTILSLCGVYIRDYQLQRWTSPDDPANPAGINDTWIVFVQDLRRRGAVYAVLTASDDKHQLRDGDLVSFDAVFVKRWSGQLPDGRWRWMPLLVTLGVKKLPPPEGGIWGITLGIAIMVGVGTVILFFAARNELKKAGEARLHAKARMKANKQLLDGKLKKLKDEDAAAEAEASAKKQQGAGGAEVAAPPAEPRSGETPGKSPGPSGDGGAGGSESPGGSDGS